MIGYISLLDGRTVAIVMPSAPADAAPDTLAEPCPATLRSPRVERGMSHGIDRFKVAKAACRPTGALCAIGRTVAAVLVAASIMGGFAGERSALAKPHAAKIVHEKPWGVYAKVDGGAVVFFAALVTSTDAHPLRTFTKESAAVRFVESLRGES